MFARAAARTPVLVRGFASSARVDYKVAVLGAAGGSKFEIMESEKKRKKNGWMLRKTT